MRIKVRKVALLALFAALVCPLRAATGKETKKVAENAELESKVADLEAKVQRLEALIERLQQEADARASARQAASRESTPGSQQKSLEQRLERIEKVVKPEKASRALKVSGLAFGDYYFMAGNHDASLEDQNGFWLRRIYLTFDKPLADNVDARLRFEMGSAGDFFSKSKLNPFVKDAYVRWRYAPRQQVYVGISASPTWDKIEGFWGYRPLEKTILDLQKFGSSREFGVAFKGSFDKAEKVGYHFMVGNGNGESSESNEGKKVLFALDLHPSNSLFLQFYTDFDDRSGDGNRSTYQGFLGYKRPWGRVGVQYAHQIRRAFGSHPELQLDALSTFAVFNVSPRTAVIGRYDRLFDPNPDGAKISYLPFDPNAKSNFFLFGVDLKVAEQFSLLPNVEIVRYDELPDGTRPGTDWVPRVTFFYHF